MLRNLRPSPDAGEDKVGLLRQTDLTLMPRYSKVSFLLDLYILINSYSESCLS